MGNNNNNNNNSSSSSCKNRCKGCSCRQLKKIQTGTVLDVFLKGGTVLEDVTFVNINKKTCCAYFCDSETEPGSVIVVSCKNIQAIRFEAANS